MSFNLEKPVGPLILVQSIIPHPTDFLIKGK